MDYSPGAMVGLYINRIERVEHFSPDTVKNRRSDLNVFARYLNSRGFDDVREVRLSIVKDFFETYFEKGRKRNSIDTIQRHVRHFFTYLNEEEEIEFQLSPKKIKAIGTEKVYKQTIPRDVVYQVLASIEDPQLRLLVLLFFSTGMRVSDIVKIEVQNIGPGYISVVGKGRNGGKRREILIKDNVMDYLNSFLASTGRTNGYLLRRKQEHKNTPKDAPIHRDTARRWLKELFLPFGYNCPPHIARYTFAQDMLFDGADIVVIKECLGHENIATTQKYLNVPPEHVRSEYEKHMTLQFSFC